MKLSQIAFRNINRNRRRSLLSGLAIAIAALAISFYFALITGIMHDLSTNLFNFSTGEVLIRHAEYAKYQMLNPLYLNVDSYGEIISDLKELKGVKAVSPRITYPALIKKFHVDETMMGQGLGLDLNLEKHYQDLGKTVISGTLPAMGTQEAALGYLLAKDLDVKVGDKVTLQYMRANRSPWAVTMRVSGLLNLPVAAFNKVTFITPLDTTQKNLYMPGKVTEILIKRQGGSPEALARTISSMLQTRGYTQLEVKPYTMVALSAFYLKMIDGIYWIMGLIFFVLGSTVIINTTMMVVFERMREIGTIAAMGMTGGEIVRLFFLEAFFISLVSAFIGVVLGTLLTIPLSYTGISFGAALDSMDFEFGSVIYPMVNWRSTLFVFLYSVAIASLTSLIPSRRAAKIEVVEALRTV